MSEYKKLTVTDLIKNKEKLQKRDNVTEELYIERLNATVVIRKPERSLCLEIIQMANDPNQVNASDTFAVYSVCVEPNLKDKELQKEFGCVEPTDIVEKIFEPGEISAIASAAFSLSGFDNSVKKVKDIKN